MKEIIKIFIKTLLLIFVVFFVHKLATDVRGVETIGGEFLLLLTPLIYYVFKEKPSEE